MRVFGCNKGVTNCVTKGVTNVKKSAGSESNQRSRDFELCNSVLVTSKNLQPNHLYTAYWSAVQCVFYAGCQPGCPSEHQMPPELYVPGADAPYLPGAGWMSFRTSEVLGTYPPQPEYSFNVSPHGTFMIQFYYMRYFAICQFYFSLLYFPS